jgi:hypothetical protein
MTGEKPSARSSEDARNRTQADEDPGHPQEPTGTCVVCGDFTYSQDGGFCPKHEAYYADYIEWAKENDE